MIEDLSVLDEADERPSCIGPEHSSVPVVQVALGAISTQATAATIKIQAAARARRARRVRRELFLERQDSSRQELRASAASRETLIDRPHTARSLPSSRRDSNREELRATAASRETLIDCPDTARSLPSSRKEKDASKGGERAIQVQQL